MLGDGCSQAYFFYKKSRRIRFFDERREALSMKEKSNDHFRKKRENVRKNAKRQESRLIPVLKALEGENVILTVDLAGGERYGEER